jgi:hypothetical protein
MWQIFFKKIVDYNGDSVQHWFYQLAMELSGFVPNFDGSFSIPIAGKPMFLVLVMATISKRRRNEASILTSFLISKRNEPAYSRTCKDRSEANPAYSIEAK